jgi:hypothetical protein
MLARVFTTQVQAAKIDELIGNAQGIVTSAEAKTQKGFKGYLLLVDRNVGKVVGIQLWEAEADMQAFLSGPYQGQMAPILSLFTAPPVTEVYEVGVQA